MLLKVFFEQLNDLVAQSHRETWVDLNQKGIVSRFDYRLFMSAIIDGSPEGEQVEALRAADWEAEESEDGGQPAWQHRILKRSAPSTEVQIQ